MVFIFTIIRKLLESDFIRVMFIDNNNQHSQYMDEKIKGIYGLELLYNFLKKLNQMIFYKGV